MEDQIVVELKAADGILPVHEAQLHTYMKLLSKPKGILINFNSAHLIHDGIKQMMNEVFSNLQLQ